LSEEKNIENSYIVECSYAGDAFLFFEFFYEFKNEILKFSNENNDKIFPTKNQLNVKKQLKIDELKQKSPPLETKVFLNSLKIVERFATIKDYKSNLEASKMLIDVFNNHTSKKVNNTAVSSADDSKEKIELEFDKKRRKQDCFKNSNSFEIIARLKRFKKIEFFDYFNSALLFSRSNDTEKNKEAIRMLIHIYDSNHDNKNKRFLLDDESVEIVVKCFVELNNKTSDSVLEFTRRALSKFFFFNEKYKVKFLLSRINLTEKVNS
jgi:hypothetical protein